MKLQRMERRFFCDLCPKILVKFRWAVTEGAVIICVGCALKRGLAIEGIRQTVQDLSPRLGGEAKS